MSERVAAGIRKREEARKPKPVVAKAKKPKATVAAPVVVDELAETPEPVEEPEWQAPQG